MLYKFKRKLEKFLIKRKILKLIKKLRPQKTNFSLVRLGGNSDGGYLLPDDLKGIEACFSAGVGELSNFEYDCAQRGIEVFMADASVEGPMINHPKFHFFKKFIGDKNKDDVITLDDWVITSLSDSNENLLLQMDVEGSEYEILNSVSFTTINKFRIIIVEFHHLQALSQPEFFQKAEKAFQKILNNFVCVHIHPNNCCGAKNMYGIEVPAIAEFTFIRKDRVKILGNAKTFPHELDEDNTGKPSLPLPRIWYN